MKMEHKEEPAKEECAKEYPVKYKENQTNLVSWKPKEESVARVK